MTTEDKKIRVVIIDDHPVVRQGLSLLLQQENLDVCGEAEDREQALQVIKETNPDLALVDISLKDTNGLELVKDLKALHEDIKILVLSMHDEQLYAERALRAGAGGYIMKQEAPEKLIEALQKVINGEMYVSEVVNSKMMQKFIDGNYQPVVSQLELLSDRELEVFQLIGEGLSTRQIASNLNLSIKTIETYRQHIKRKLSLANATELVHHAIQWVQSQS